MAGPPGCQPHQLSREKLLQLGWRSRHLLEVNYISIGYAIIESDNGVLLLSIFALKESVTYPMECAMVIEDVGLFSASLVQGQSRP